MSCAVSIKIINASRRKTAYALLQEYLLEVSRYDNKAEILESGEAKYDYFPLYWQEKSRFPYFIMLEKEIIGFAFVRTLENMEYDMAEFYIKPQYRKKYFGQEAAAKIFSAHPGIWNLTVTGSNEIALVFWSKMVTYYKIQMFDNFADYFSWKINTNKTSDKS